MPDMPEQEPIILASSSPRRKQLMTEAGYRFTTVEPRPEAECGMCSGEAPPELVARLAFQKAADVRERLLAKGSPPVCIIACDTVAACLGQILGKPRDEDDARLMLKLLSGRQHEVYSGLCVWNLPQGEPRVEVARSILRMHVLQPATIDEYLASGLWEGKAGAFGYQDRHGWLELVEGSESNIVGLPMELLEKMLAPQV